MMGRPIHICSFSAGIDDLTRKEQRNNEAVVAVLREAGRFSVFEASANEDIARTMTRLCARRLTTDNSCGYPWTTVVAIDGIPLATPESAASSKD